VAVVRAVLRAQKVKTAIVPRNGRGPEGLLFETRFCYTNYKMSPFSLDNDLISNPMAKMQ